jgi:phage tail-like protein
MDANGTRFHLLCGFDDWSHTLLADGITTLEQASATSPPFAGDALDAAGLVDPKAVPELCLRALLPRSSPSRGNRPVGFESRRGAARDRYGNWYVVSGDRRRIDVRSSGSDRVTAFWPPDSAAGARAAGPAPGDFAAKDPPVLPEECSFGALVVTRDHFLVATSTLGARTELLVFDLFAGGPPTHLSWPRGVALEPWDMAPREPRGFWLLDRMNRRLWELNGAFCVVRPEGFAPPGPEPGVAAGGFPSPDATSGDGDGACEVSKVTTEHALVLVESVPIAVEPLPGGGALVLDAAEPPRIGAYRGSRRTGEASFADILRVIELDDESQAWKLMPHDFAVVAEANFDALGPGAAAPTEATELRAVPLLFVADQTGNQAFCLELTVSEAGGVWLSARRDFFPMRLFGGMALVAAEGGAFYDAPGRFVPLVAQARPRYAERAIVLTLPFDGDAPGCVWHRLLFDACIPTGTRVRISSRATDADGAELATPEGEELVRKELGRLAWFDEPQPVLRASGSELPWLRREALGTHATWELLLQRARGRYCQLRIILEGDSRHTPRLRAVRAYYGRFSYAERYLPACYRDDGVSGSLLERLLANYEGLVTALEDRALGLGTLCDPSAAPAEFLDWLGRWYAVYLDPGWPPARKRLFLSHALTFFQWRGTARGLRTALRLAFDDCVDDTLFEEVGDRSRKARRFRIAEGFSRRALPSTSQVAPEPCPGFDAATPTAEVPWQPADGREALNRRWRKDSATTTDYPLTSPADATTAATWSAFSTRTLGFVPSAGERDAGAWREYLRRRYHAFADARAAWGEAFEKEWDSFADVELPAALPPSTRGLDDWAVFHRTLQPMRATAHRFSVSLPVRPEAAKDAERLRTQLHLADRLIALEKPAHSSYRVELYWALFRVGEVRLGVDTELGQGSRLAELLPPMILGQGALAEGRLAPRPLDWNERRVVLGQTPLPASQRPPGAAHRDFENPRPE